LHWVFITGNIDGKDGYLCEKCHVFLLADSLLHGSQACLSGDDDTWPGILQNPSDLRARQRWRHQRRRQAGSEDARENWGKWQAVWELDQHHGCNLRPRA
jgi:hypothetical protein